MKYARALFLVPFLGFLTSFAHAGMGGNSVPSLVYQVAIGSQTMQTGLLIATATTNATQMDSPQLVGRATIDIQNVDSTNNFWCTFVSTMPVAGKGVKVPSGTHWTVNVKDQIAVPGGTPVAVKFWCLSDGTNVSSATVTQLY